MRDLVPQPGIEPRSPALGVLVLPTGPPGKSLDFVFEKLLVGYSGAWDDATLLQRDFFFCRVSGDISNVGPPCLCSLVTCHWTTVLQQLCHFQVTLSPNALLFEISPNQGLFAHGLQQ